ncbi:MAG: hypothetical protein FWG25_04115 [Promicromonosporaceae bacterium]|nr:hypothetical protein [Promicromonosporaceae bacterium]
MAITLNSIGPRRTEPINTLRVYGGSGLNQIDTATMAATLNWLGQCSDAVSRLSVALGQISTSLGKAARQWLAIAWSSPPPFADPLTLSEHNSRCESARQRAGSASRVADLAEGFRQQSVRTQENLERLRSALLRATGTYEQAESAVSRLFPAPWRWQSPFTGVVSGFAVLAKLNPGYLLLALPPVIAGAVPAVGAHFLTKGKSTKWLSETAVVELAPHTPWLLSGLGQTLAITALMVRGLPKPKPGEASVTSASRMIRAFLRFSETKVEVTQIFPGHPAFGCPSPMPAWQGTPTGSIREGLSRTADLHPFDPAEPHPDGYPSCGSAGLPKGTVAVERIVKDGIDDDDDVVTWAVLIPGTQSFAHGKHAFDGSTDLDLMAHEADQVSAEVMEALKLAGVQKGQKIVLIGHSLGGIAAVSLAASREFQALFDLGGVVTAGSPTATFEAVPGVPYLHLENDEEVVSNLDGKAGEGNPRSDKRVTVTRRLSASDDPIDQQAARSLEGAHQIPTHQRTFDLALESGDAAVHEVTAEIEYLLSGDSSETWLYTGRRVPI